MKFDVKKSIMILGSLGVSSMALASSNFLVLPACLHKDMGNISHEVMAIKELKVLVKVDDSQLEHLAMQAHKTHCGGFMNVSNDQEAKENPVKFLQAFVPLKLKSNFKKTYKISHEVQVNKLLKQVEPQNIWHTLEGLTSFDDRYSRGENGLKAALWLQDKFNAMVHDAKRNDVTTFLVETGGGYQQPSLVTKVGKDLPGEAIVIGAHMDTLSYMKPGADDDGSGSSSLMETARVILNAKKLRVPVYFIWYSAEEMGLVGSQKVVKHFVKEQIAVKSVLQFDMTGYRRNGSDKMWMIGDHINKPLSKYVNALIKKYIGVDVGWSDCGYACSDHASWTQAGYASAFPVESRFGDENPYIHTGNDTMAHVSLEHMTNFSKLGVAFVIEQASSVARS